jgi:formate dehydrogenase major subunit
MVSLLKAWYGDAATRENDCGFDWLPRITQDNSQLQTFIRMAEGQVRGLFLLGQNPAFGAPNARLNREALRQLDWLVVRDFFLIASATFWNEGPDAPDPRAIATEVFFMPAAAPTEKDGSMTNTSGSCSGTPRRLIRPETSARTCGSCGTSAGASRRCTPAAPGRGTRASST